MKSYPAVAAFELVTVAPVVAPVVSAVVTTFVAVVPAVATHLSAPPAPPVCVALLTDASAARPAVVMAAIVVATTPLRGHVKARAEDEHEEEG